MKRVAALSLVFMSWMSPYAYADIYGYIDADGSAHFSTEKLDERYQLYVREDADSDASFRSSPPAPALTEFRQTPLASYLSRHPNLQKYEPLLTEAAREFALDPALLKAVMAAESGFNAHAVSPKGAIGLMQVMPATAQRYGVQGDRRQSVAQKLTDPKTNIRVGARYLRDLHKMFPSSPELVIASYNAGEGAVQKYNNAIPPYPETRSYVQIVKQLYQVYKPAAQRIAVAALSANDSQPHRIHMTIPGRRNMPPAAKFD